MAIIGMEGFDHYATGGLATNLLNDVEGYFAAAGYGDPYCETTDTRFNTGKRLKLYWLDYFSVSVGNMATNTIYVSYAFRYEMVNNDKGTLLGVTGQYGNAHAVVYINRGGTITIYDGYNVLKSTSTLTLNEDTWYWVEIKVVVSDTGSVTVNVDGVEYVTSSSDFLRDTPIPLIKSFWISGGGNGNYCYYDDLVWQDDDGDFLGDSRIETFTPTGDASVTWDNSVDAGGPPTVTNASTIDEIPVSDTDYVYTATSGEEDLYSFDTISNDDIVHGISLKYRAQKSDTGARSIQSRTSETIAGDDFQGGAERALSTDWIWYSDVFETTDDGDPLDAGTAWSQQLIEDATFGIKVTA